MGQLPHPRQILPHPRDILPHRSICQKVDAYSTEGYPWVKWLIGLNIQIFKLNKFLELFIIIILFFTRVLPLKNMFTIIQVLESLPRCPCASLPPCPCASLPRCPYGPLHRCPNASLPRYPNASFLRCPNTCLPRCLGLECKKATPQG